MFFQAIISLKELWGWHTQKAPAAFVIYEIAPNLLEECRYLCVVLFC